MSDTTPTSQQRAGWHTLDEILRHYGAGQIERAVNCHGEMLHALTRIRDGHSTNGDGLSAWTHEVAREAIAKAEGR